VLYRNRESLYAQIDERVDNMIKNGLISEVKSLVERYGYLDNSAFSAIGYKEIITYLRGKTSLEEAIRQIKLNTRHYSKRQITYYKKMAVEEYIDVDSKTPSEVATHIYDRLKAVYYKV
ncbi:MAG: tRNA dimethylallyltransferase, partial [Clostridia bacterium]|nr:tRNA dimethylallyltransferase [Clostridia bacterium]